MMKYFILTVLLIIGIQLNAQVGIGTTSPHSTLDVNGSFSTNVQIQFSGTLDLNDTHHTILAGNSATINLPSGNTCVGREYTIKAGNLGATVNAVGSDNIDGSTNISLSSGEAITVQSIGGNTWAITSDERSGSSGSINDLTDAKAVPGSFSVYLGEFAGLGADGQYNVALGGGSALNMDGDENVIIGVGAGTTLTTGNSNVFVGRDAGSGSTTGITTGGNNIMIGYSVYASAQTANNELNIGNTIYGANLYGSNAMVGIGNGNNSPTSTLTVNGSLSLPIRTTTTATTLTDTDYTLLVNNSTSNAANVTLPSAIGRGGRIYVIKIIVSNRTQTLLPAAGQTIDGGSSYTLAGGSRTTVQSDNANWWVID